MFWASLKLETRMSPGLSTPPVGKGLGTNATPYGFTSPFVGIVETVMLGTGRVRALPARVGWRVSRAVAAPRVQRRARCKQTPWAPRERHGRIGPAAKGRPLLW